MSILSRWRREVDDSHARDVEIEAQHRIRSNVPKTWHTRADIRRLEEEMAPWLRKKRKRDGQ
jgi:hypothetical protein